ncbi:MAG: hypothetical protein OEZ01_12390, partial [Candidatus Heimdallarchaeota archaeon]|nr:hypothetical protein [Candidatus Heimdallarchaeota archaeon]
THLYNIIGERELVFHIIREKWLEGILYADNAEISLKHAGPSKTAIISWSYSKREILDFVLGGDIFLPKTTRHELKYLVGKCNVPLGSLK